MKKNSGKLKFLNGIKSYFSGIFAKRKAEKNEEWDSIYCSPVTSMGAASEIVGLVCRSLVAFAGIFGIMFLLFEATGVYKKNADFRVFTLPMYAMLLFSLAAALLWAFASYNRITAAAVPAGIAAIVLVWALIASSGAPFLYLENALRRLYNDIIYGISLKGYTALSDIMLDTRYSFGKEGLLTMGCFLFALIIGAVMYFAVLGKARAWLFVLLNGLFALPMFLGNLPGSNLGFAMIAGAFGGFLAILGAEKRYSGVYEKRYGKKQKRNEKKSDRKTLRNERRLARLRVKDAAQKIYDTALEADMGTSKAAAAKRSVYIKVKETKLLERKNARLQKREAKKEKKLLRKEEKKNKKNAALKQKQLIKAEKKLPKEQRDAARRTRLENEKARKARLSAEKAKVRAEKRAERNLEEVTFRKKRAAGGYAGAVSLAVALLAIWLPALLVTKAFPIIEALDDEISYIRAFTDDVLMGDNVDLTSKWLYGDFEKFVYEELTFEAREYEDVQIFKVESVRKDPVYLRSRVADKFDFEKGEWTYADSEKVIDYKNKFGGGFSPDSILSRSYGYLYPASANIPTRMNYTNYNLYGFTVQQIHLYRVNGESRLLFTPSVMNTNQGILERDSSEKGKYRYVSYYEGVYTSGFYGTGTDGYSAVSYVFNMKRSDMGEVLQSQSETLDIAKQFADRVKAGSNKETLLAEYNEAVKGQYLENTLGERLLTEMTKEEIEDFKTYMSIEDRYADFVYKNYLPETDEEKYEERFESTEEIKSLAEEIEKTAKGGEDALRHNKVLAVISYLCSEDFSYELAPEVTEESEMSVLETFLFDTKEGYCSHYATAAAVLLREMGIPARYVEGYIANEWYDNYGTQQAAKYRSDVRDRHSHTWIEVYYDNIGWVPYEVTKTFAVEMFGETESGVIIDPVADDTPKEEPKNETDEIPDVIIDEPEEQINPLAQFKWLIISVGIFLVLYAVAHFTVRYIKKRAQKEIDKRYRTVDKAKNEEVFRDKSVDKREMTRYINDCIFDIFKAVGIGPMQGELLEEFGVRLKNEYGNLSTEDPVFVMACINKEEFGHGLNYTELCSVAEYLSDVMVSVYSGLTPMQKLRLRYFKRII